MVGLTPFCLRGAHESLHEKFLSSLAAHPSVDLNLGHVTRVCEARRRTSVRGGGGCRGRKTLTDVSMAHRLLSEILKETEDVEEIEYLTDGSWRPIRDEKEKERERERSHTPEYPQLHICEPRVFGRIRQPCNLFSEANSSHCYARSGCMMPCMHSMWLFDVDAFSLLSSRMSIFVSFPSYLGHVL